MRISDWSSDVCSSDLLAISLAAQVLLVFGGILRVLPLTGLTSPFLSYGGSSMVMAWVMLALIVVAASPERREANAPVRRLPVAAVPRSEERRVGKECVSTC